MATDNLWTQGRSLIQHLISLRQSPLEWSVPARSGSTDSPPQSFSDCMSDNGRLAKKIDLCSAFALAEVRAAWSTPSKISVQLKERIRLFTYLATMEFENLQWESWMNLAAANVLSEDFRAAQQVIDKAKLILSKKSVESKWMMDRMTVFEKGLYLLVNSNVPVLEEAQPKFEIRTQDAQILYLENQIQKIEQSKNPKKLFDRKVDIRECEAALISLLQQRWALMQDRAEIIDLRHRLNESRFDLSMVRRIDVLSKKYLPQMENLRTSLSALTKIAASSDVLLRNDGMFLIFDLWLMDQKDTKRRLAFDDDLMLQRQSLIVDEYIRFLLISIDQKVSRVPLLEERKQLAVIRDRLQGMLSQPGLTLERSQVSKEIELSLLTVSELNRVTEAVSSVRSQLVSLQFSEFEHGTLNAEGKSLQDELRQIQDERRKLIFDFANESASVLPFSRETFDILLRRIGQVQKTLNDLRTILTSPDDLNFQGEQAELFFRESSDLLSGIESDSRKYMLRKVKETVEISWNLKQVDSDYRRVESEFNQFMKTSAADFRPHVIFFLKVVDGIVLKKERALELIAQIETKKIRDILLSEKKENLLKKEKMNNLLRMTKENLEWRFAQ